jgi:hypothetical protein
MHKKFFVLLLALLMTLAIMLMAAPEEQQQVIKGDSRQCSWQPGDDHKMHFPQLPDESGWDVNATQPMILADDFMCMRSGPITDIHFWGGWKGDVFGQVNSFVLSIHEDIPAGSPIDTCHANGDCNNDGIGLTVPDADCLFQYLYNMGSPPDPLYKCDLNGDCVVNQADLDVYQGYFVYGISYFDQYGGYPVPTCCDENWTYSRPGQTLWERTVTEFEITQFDPPSTEGWFDPATGEVIKDNQQHYFQYDICFLPDDPNLFVQDSGTVYWLNISAIVADPQNTTWGWKSTQDHWNDDAVWAYWNELNWIDIWEPSDTLYNTFFIFMSPDGALLEGGGEGAYGEGWYYYPQSEWWNIWFFDHEFAPDRRKRGFIEFDIVKNDPASPMSVEVAVNWSTELWSIDHPGENAPPLPGEPEGLYIGREYLWVTDFFEGHVGPLEYILPDFCPEWVSVDIRGFNYDIPSGVIAHECQGSLDLAFVITGPAPEPPEACCFPDGGCDLYPPTECMSFGGLPLGPGTVCSVQRACCYADGSCQVMDTLCCLALGETPTEYLNCGGDLNVNGVDDSCETSWGACCLPEGDCEMMSQDDCDISGGEYEGDGVECLGDANENGVNDQCDTWSPFDPSKMHFPQTPDPVGWDVSATSPEMIADDWMCTASGPVTDIHFWGSWLANDIGTITSFALRIYADVPADVDLPYSHPGEMLWEYRTGEFNIWPMQPELQGWYDPHQGAFMEGDHSDYFQYDVYIPESDQFTQEEGTIYWLSVSAQPVDPENTHWGWKSSIENWNDNAANLAANWLEMFKPVEFTEPLDLSFVIGGVGQICDCIPGDCNGDGTVNIGDAVCLICYVFQGCIDPQPYSTCSGDANCDCQSNVGDAVFIISYVFKGGPAPCSCEEWVSYCGWPIRK